MAKTRRQSKKTVELHPFDVYEQTDGALVVLSSEDEPEVDLEPVWSGEAANEKEAIRAARKSAKAYRKAPAANPEHDPDMPDDTRRLAEEATNKRLGITTRPARRKGAKKRTKSAAKSGARKSTRGAKKGVRKKARR